MNISSPAFQYNQQIPSKYTCDGDNILPPLSFSDIPENARSLALVVDDPDAPNGNWVHWIAYNIDSKITGIPEGSIPPGSIQGKNSAGSNKFHGPCPPSGTHRYFFKLYALDIDLDKNENMTKEELEEAIKTHVLDSAELIGLYARNK